MINILVVNYVTLIRYHPGQTFRTVEMGAQSFHILHRQDCWGLSLARKQLL